MTSCSDPEGVAASGTETTPDPSPISVRIQVRSPILILTPYNIVSRIPSQMIPLQVGRISLKIEKVTMPDPVSDSSGLISTVPRARTEALNADDASLSKTCSDSLTDRSGH